VKFKRIFCAVLFLAVIFLGGALLFGTLQRASGNVTGVVVASREDDVNGQTLLIEVQGQEGAKSDEVHIDLPEKVLQTVKAGALPQGWNPIQEEGYLKISGQSVNLPFYIRLDLGDTPPPSKLGIEVYHEGNRTYRKKSLKIDSLPPVSLIHDFSSVLRFPPLISPGDLLFFTPMDNEKTPVDGTWEVGETTAEYDYDKARYKLKLGYDLDLGGTIGLKYKDPFEVTLYDTDVLSGTKITFRIEEDSPYISSVSPMAFYQDYFCVCGHFPDDQSRNGILMDGKALGIPVSSSSHVIIHLVPSWAEYGFHDVSGDVNAGYSSETLLWIEVIGIKGSVDRDKLMRGERTPLKLLVEGTDKPLTLKLVNKTPEIVKLEGGPQQELNTSGGSPNQLEKMVQGLARGDFNISYNLDLPFCPCYENLDERIGKEFPEYFENLFDDAFNDFREARDTVNEGHRLKDFDLEDSKNKAKESLEIFSRAREKIKRGQENGDIGPNTSSTMLRYISRYEAEANEILKQEEETELPITHRPEVPTRPEEPVQSVVTDGWFAPTQGVWQGDEVFRDFEGKQLSNTGPGQWNAELKMVAGRPTLIFGIRKDGRFRVTISGTTNGTKRVSVKFRFKLIQGGTEKILYTQPKAENHVRLDGPTGPDHPFATSMMVSRGIPTYDPFTIDSPGPYRLEMELIRDDTGEETGLKVVVSGEAIQTFGPSVRVVPVVLSDANPPGWGGNLAHKAQILATRAEENIPCFFPVVPGGMRVSAEGTRNFESTAPGWGRKLVSMLPFTDTTEEVQSDSLAAAIAQYFSTDASAGTGEKIFALLSDHDFDLTRRGGEAAAYAASSKYMVGRHDINYESLAHEVVHTIPYLWSSPQMVSIFGINYHNDADNQYGDGVEIWPDGFRFLRKRIYAVMGSEHFGKWITQATYYHLLDELRTKPDPELLLVRGYIAREGEQNAGFFIPFYETRGTADLESLSEEESKDWVIVALNKEGQELARYPLRPRWRVVDMNFERNILSFTHRIPALSDMEQVEIYGPMGRLDRRVKSASSPVIQIMSPSDGSTVKASDTLGVTWKATDPDGDALTYLVYYSPDNGRTWRLESMDQEETSYEIPILKSVQKIRVRIHASDGFRSATDEITINISR
jgi:hypothetical protein